MPTIKKKISKTLAKKIPWLFSDVNVALAKCLQRLSQLNQAIFTCYLTRDYFEQHYVYEKLFHDRRRDFLFAMKKFRRYKNYEDISRHIENLYEIILSLGLLIYRVPDASTFEIASKEFYAITENLSVMFRDLSAFLLDKKDFPSLPFSLVENIQQLEEVNQSALQLVSPDPMVFLIFIQDLQALNIVLTELSLDMLTMNVERK